MATELSPHQTKAIEELHSGAVLLGGVGSGKTRTALAYYYTKVCQGSLKINGKGKDGLLQKPRDLYIITTARKRDELDWQEEALAFRLSNDRSLSISGVSMIVDSYNNIKNYTEIKDAFFIFDEQRLVGSGVWVDSFIKIAKNNEWILLSATPGDVWMDYMPLFVANGFYKNKTEFIREHVIFDRFAKYPKIDRYIATGRLDRYRKSILVEMPFTRHTMRHISYVNVEHNEWLYNQVLKENWDPFEGEPIEQPSKRVLLERKVVNMDESRLEAVETIVKRKKKVIIFYFFNYELYILRNLASRLNIQVNEWNGIKHEPVPTGDEWVYLVQYTAGNEAWNCITTDTMIFYSMQYSYKVFEQCLGRIDRMNTSYRDLYYYVLRSEARIDQQLTKAIRAKENFNLRAYEEGYN